MSIRRSWVCAPLAMWLVCGCGPAADDIAANLSSDNPVVREDSAKMARKHDDDAVIKALVVAIQLDPSARVREHAVDSLAELEAVDAVPALIEVVQRDPEADVVSAAIDALGRLADPRAVPVLLAHLETNGADRPTLNVIWALGNIGDGRALPLLTSLRDTDDAYVAYNVERALRELKPVMDDSDVAPAEAPETEPSSG